MVKKRIFVENINMETQTVFHANGNIMIYPCDFELGQQIVANGTHASQKGRMVTDQDGRSSFKAYVEGSGSRYHTIFPTEHGEVKETQANIIFTLRFPKKVDKAKVEAAFKDEMQEMAAWIKTRKTQTKW